MEEIPVRVVHYFAESEPFVCLFPPWMPSICLDLHALLLLPY